jgi:hypothetical protein
MCLRSLWVDLEDKFNRMWGWGFHGGEDGDDVLGFGSSPEDTDSMFLRNVGIYLRVYTARKHRRTYLKFVLSSRCGRWNALLNVQASTGDDAPFCAHFMHRTHKKNQQSFLLFKQCNDSTGCFMQYYLTHDSYYVNERIKLQCTDYFEGRVNYVHWNNVIFCSKFHMRLLFCTPHNSCCYVTT